MGFPMFPRPMKPTVVLPGSAVKRGLPRRSFRI
jgi:hypothetical protein